MLLLYWNVGWYTPYQNWNFQMRFPHKKLYKNNSIMKTLMRTDFIWYTCRFSSFVNDMELEWYFRNLIVKYIFREIIFNFKRFEVLCDTRFCYTLHPTKLSDLNKLILISIKLNILCIKSSSRNSNILNIPIKSLKHP